MIVVNWYAACHMCVDAEYKYGQNDEADDEKDRPLGLPSGVYGRKYYMSTTSFDNLENVSMACMFVFLWEYLFYRVTFCTDILPTVF